MKRFLVWFTDGCPGEFEFDTFKEADHFARLNAGTVLDTETGKMTIYGEEGREDI